MWEREEVGNARRANIPRLVDNFPQYSHSIIVAHVLKADVIHLSEMEHNLGCIRSLMSDTLFTLYYLHSPWATSTVNNSVLGSA